jgi:phospholipid transport system substrate-binding protein
MKYYSLTLFGLISWWNCIFAEAEVSPLTELQKTVTHAVEVLYGPDSLDKSSEVKRQEVRAGFEAVYDLNILIRRAIGRNWKRMSADEQTEVVELIKQLVLKAYIDGMKGKARPVIAYGELITLNDKRLEIPSTVLFDGRIVNLKYRFARMQTGWELYDLIAEEISLVSNYRQQFDEHFRRNNASSLIEKLNKLLLNEKFEPKTPF